MHVGAHAAKPKGKANRTHPPASQALGKARNGEVCAERFQATLGVRRGKGKGSFGATGVAETSASHRQPFDARGGFDLPVWKRGAVRSLHRDRDGGVACVGVGRTMHPHQRPSIAMVQRQQSADQLTRQAAQVPDESIAPDRLYSVKRRNHRTGR